MAEFVIKVADERGRMLQSVEQGYSVAEVRDRYASQGYLVYWVKPQGMLAGGLAFGRRRKLKQSSFLVFNQQFSDPAESGITGAQCAGSADQAAAGPDVRRDPGKCCGRGSRVVNCYPTPLLRTALFRRFIPPP